MEEILAEAAGAGASDVHIMAGIPPKMRVKGKLTTMSFPQFLPADTLSLLISMMNQTQRELFEERGELDMAYEIYNLGRFRVSAYKQRGNVALALRLIGNGIPSPESLGIPEQVMELSQKRRGLVLVTGPAGSGKSTTLAAIVDRINRTEEAHIITLEEPIEYLHRHMHSIVSQREIGLDCPSYASALRAALREDPDVILVGELRDGQAVDGVLTAAEAGHLVLSALHTSGTAEDAVDYMVDMFPVYRQRQIRMRIADMLEAVVIQRPVWDEDGQKERTEFELTRVTELLRRQLKVGAR